MSSLFKELLIITIIIAEINNVAKKPITKLIVSIIFRKYNKQFIGKNYGNEVQTQLLYCCSY